jgi:hypothetical protein
MDFAIDLIQKIPAGWPRWATLAAIGLAYFFFPDLVKKLSGGQEEKEILERLTRFLQVKKLLLELKVFQKEKNLAGFEFPGEQRLLAELQETSLGVSKSQEKIRYITRVRYALLGGAVFWLLTAVVFFLAERQETLSVQQTARFLARDLIFSATCGLLASSIPLGTQRASLLYGLTMPLALALLVLIVRH